MIYPARGDGDGADRWDEDRKRMNDFGRQAQETFTELSEATLDSLLTTIEMLKAKLAEQKAQREKEDRELEALRQEQQRQYEEWKRQQPPRHIV
ncbi:hypothetical protein NLI96_g6539 [Meripilus lineatus]|uniref:Uncharacterized protein n=1 Tax=Meripilus lineatus TaxID=2056292 RepID=A0AAD5YCV4_9APHY|nr:hypothetical protein NLI96_g6539 [Physisporinus lineatus]